MSKNARLRKKIAAKIAAKTNPERERDATLIANAEKRLPKHLAALYAKQNETGGRKQ